MGRLGRPNGLDGFIGIYIEDEDLVHLQVGSTVHVEDRPHIVRAVRRGKKGWQVAFSGINDRDGAEAIRGSNVYVSERRSLRANEYWPDQLIGLEVRPGGGRVTEVSHGVAQDRLVIARGDSHFEIPFVDELVPVVDLEAGYVEIIEIDGLSSP
ncbi:MAG: ribosome maturation factor RimM [Acidimicrobiia bacterium]